MKGIPGLKQVDGRWYIAITGRHPDGKVERVRQSFSTKREAEAALDRFRTRRERWRTGVDDKRPKVMPVTFTALTQKFLSELSAHKRWNTLKSHRQGVKSLLRTFGELMLTEITPAMVSSWYSTHRTEVPVAANRDLQLLKRMLKMAKKWFGLKDNPAEEEEVAKERETIIRVLNDEEAAKFLEVAEPNVRPIFQLLLITGLRKNEALSLKWEFPGWEHEPGLDCSIISFRRGVIHVPALRAKGGKSREIPLSPELETFFRELQAGSKSEFVFGVKEIWKSLKRAAAKAEIKHLTVHALRHTAASRMLKGGTDVKTVSELLGHATLAMTMRYLHSDSPSKQDAVAKMSSLYLGASQKVATEGKPDSQTVEYKPFKILEN